MKSFKYFWQDFNEGQEASLGTHKVSEKDILEFGRKFDPQYFHTDPVWAKESPFGGLIACGWHTCAIMMRLMCNNFLVDTATMGAPGVDNLKWLLPLKPNDEITGFWKVLERRESNSKPNLGIVKAKVQGFNQKDKCIITMEPTLLIFKNPKSYEDKGP